MESKRVNGYFRGTIWHRCGLQQNKQVQRKWTLPMEILRGPPPQKPLFPKEKKALGIICPLIGEGALVGWAPQDLHEKTPTKPKGANRLRVLPGTNS